MEITLQTGAYSGSVANTSQNVGAESFTPVIQASGIDVRDTAANQENIEQKDIREVLERTIELVSIGDRGIKFEMVEDADMYQIHVIDMSDGRVVRKIPPDEVLKMITHLKEQMSDHVDVLA